ncbi:hypothetical protein LTR53_017297 [Teratosphaeriaceae sp. CCFEE 6253]|nr:hypothetical protein LTR53_017297 [Teratosphaeriaceae sp. CCFEE 6253]
MPTYLLHGFRWPRPLIRVHIILQNLDDAASEWLIAPPTTHTLLRNFDDLYPDCMRHLRSLRFVEQYDPNDTSSAAAGQPFAYVADIVQEVRLGVCIDDVTTKGIATEQWGAALELRDKLAPEEKVGWFVVVCGDEERWAPPAMGQLEAGGRSGSLGMSSEGHSEADSPGGLNVPRGNGMTNGYAQANGTSHGYAQANGHGVTNGTTLPYGQRSAPGSAGNSSSGGGSSISPPVTIQEQKMLGGAVFGSAQFGPHKSATVQHRRRTLSDRLQAGVSAPPVLAEEQVATRWNPNGVDAPFEHRLPRRSSNVPAFSNSPRAASPEYRRAHSPVSIIRSPLRTGGARSPVSTLRNDGMARSQSPLSHEIRSFEVSRNESPGRGVGNIARNGNAWAQQQHAHPESHHRQASLAALQGGSPPSQGSSPPPLLGPAPISNSQKIKHRLSLQTQIPPPPPVPEEDEEMDVISMSPAVRTPITNFRKSRSSLALSTLPGANSSQISLSGMNLTSDPNKKYFGQMIDSSDLVASGIENAFTRL